MQLFIKLKQENIVNIIPHQVSLFIRYVPGVRQGPFQVSIPDLLWVQQQQTVLK